MSMLDPLIAELEQESATTRRVLERVPEDRFDWKPHEKSMHLGRLAMHVATTPLEIAKIATRDEMQVSEFEPSPEVKTTAEVLAAHDKGLAEAKATLSGMDDTTATGMWRVLDGDKELMAMPRIALIRAIMLNHVYHHRGQLTVYLRLLDVPVPSVYGPSADENTFE